MERRTKVIEKVTWGIDRGKKSQQLRSDLFEFQNNAKRLFLEQIILKLRHFFAIGLFACHVFFFFICISWFFCDLCVAFLSFFLRFSNKRWMNECLNLKRTQTHCANHL